MLDLDQLGIIEKKLCWVLFVDILCLNDDGNLLDTSLLCLVAAIYNLLLPKIHYNESDESFNASTTEFRKLELTRCPLSLTFVYCDE